MFAPKQVEFLPVESASGRRVYVRSLCMMLYRAVVACYPECRLKMEHSISHGYYCRITGADADAGEVMAERLKAYMSAMVQRDIPFERKERLTEDVIRLFESQGML